MSINQTPAMGQHSSVLSLPVDPRYRVGTLQYTKLGLAGLFAWVLWGDFCMALMETVIPSVLPFKLQNLGASNITLSLLISTIPQMMNFMINPIISFKSDRHRGRWGRRIPFLFFATPFVTLFLILMGFSEDLGPLLHRLVFSQVIAVSPTTIIVILIGVFMVCFQFFNLFIGSVYYYLFNDVVPEAFLARFISLLRIISGAAGSFYSFFIYRYGETHMREIFVGAALLYFVAFMLMCWRVKEGQYPPPPQTLDRKTGPLAAAKTYFYECFTHRFYWYFFLTNAFYAMTAGASLFSLLMYRYSLGLSLDQIGKVGGIAQLVVIALLYPAGMISDRYHPFRMAMIALIVMTLLAPLNLVYLFLNVTPATALRIYIAIMVISLPAGILYSAAILPMYMRLLPKDRYGQFCSANAMVMAAGSVIAGLLGGLFMDLMKRIYHGDVFYYRFAPVWSVTFYAITLIFLLLLYREWKRCGGADNYTPPGPADHPLTMYNKPERAL
ncbi:MAG: MFS transporter [Phycisphaerae bacterium]